MELQKCMRLSEFLSEDAESVAERLVQGLVCGAAAKDSRFNSKFIVVLHKDRIVSSILSTQTSN